MDHTWSLIIVVFVFAAVQSLFGVGLLVFGTPTLLLLGCPFETTIAALLPASITISVMQLVAGRSYLKQAGSDILVYSVPGIIVGLAFVLSFHLVDIKLLIGIMLVGTAFMRFHETTRQVLAQWLTKHKKLFLVIMGLVHGLSNMGGGLLTVLVSATHHEREAIRANIAYGYLIFAATQLFVLALLNPGAMSLKCVICAGVALLTYLTVGQLLFHRSPKAVYQELISWCVLAYGMVLIFQQFS
jgi:uncharacterized membrane protein YfcA